MAKITGGLSPAVKSGENKAIAHAVALTEELLYDTIRGGENMDDEIKKICEEYAWAWYFDFPHRLEWQDKYFRARHNLSANDKESMTEYFCKCLKKNETFLPVVDYIGPFESYLIN